MMMYPHTKLGYEAIAETVVLWFHNCKPSLWLSPEKIATHCFHMTPLPMMTHHHAKFDIQTIERSRRGEGVYRWKSRDVTGEWARVSAIKKKKRRKKEKENKIQAKAAAVHSCSSPLVYTNRPTPILKRKRRRQSSGWGGGVVVVVVGGGAGGRWRGATIKVRNPAPRHPWARKGGRRNESSASPLVKGGKWGRMEESATPHKTGNGAIAAGHSQRRVPSALEAFDVAVRNHGGYEDVDDPEGKENGAGGHLL